MINSFQDKPDFKISDWTTAETYKFADFLSTDIFTRFLQDKYKRSSMSEVMAINKDLSPTILFNEFKNDLKTTLDAYKQQIIEREGLDKTSEDYEILDGLLEDIYNQYVGTPNESFNFIVNKRLENRFVKGGKYDDITDEDLVENQNDNENETKDTSEQNQLESWQTKQGKVDAKTKSSARLREFFSSFPLRTRLVKNNKSERTTTTDIDLYNKLYYKGEYIHNKLLVELSDNSNYIDFIQAINNLVPKYQFAGDLLAAIMNLTEKELMQAYDEGTLEIPLDVLTNQEAYPKYNMWILKDMYQAIADQTNLNPFKTLTTSKGKQVQTTKIVKSVKETDYQNALKSIKDTIDAKLQDPNKKNELKASLEEVIEAIDKKNKIADVIAEVFSQIGYEASDELLLNLQPTSSINGKEDNLSYLKKGFISILNDINDSKSTIDATGRGVDIPARLLSTYSTISSGLSYMNVENENEFAHKNSNYLTRLQSIWNKGADRKKRWVDSMRMSNNQPILNHYRNPFYDDFLKESNVYKIVPDGFIQVEEQSNSGKPYADYNKSEIIASSINAFLAKNNTAIENNTIEKGHALFHTQVYSDSPQRWFLHAPIFSKSDITKKLAQIIYSEIERIFYVKQGDLSQFEKLRAAGSIFQNIPELNDITFTTNANTTLSFSDVFNLKEWDDFNSVSIVPGLKTMTYISKTGEKVTVDTPSTNYKNLLEKIIEDYILEDNKNNFINYLHTEGVYNMIPEVVKGDDDVTGKIKETELYSFYYNTYYNNIISQNVFGGDPANYKVNKGSLKTDIDIVKRTKQEISPNILKVFKKPTFNIIILKDVELRTPLFKDKGGKDIKANTTDAGAYHTLARRREIMEADPNWDLIKNDIAPIFDRIQNGTYTQEDLQVLDLQPLKPFLYTQIIQNIDTKRPDGTSGTAAIRVPIQLKDSEHVLLPTEAFLVEGQEKYVRPISLDDITNGKYIRPDLAKLLYLMETQGVDLAVFESGSKAEVFNKVDIDSADENAITTAKVILNNSDWGIQQEVPRKDMEAKVGQGSQEHKIMSANVDPDWSFKYDGKVYKGSEGANELLSTIRIKNYSEKSEEILKKFTSLYSNYFLNHYTKSRLKNFTSAEHFYQNQLTEDGKTIIPLELALKQVAKLNQKIFSEFKKIKVFGGTLMNKSSLGYVHNDSENNLGENLKMVTSINENGNTIFHHYEAIIPVYHPAIYDFIDLHGNLLLNEDGLPLLPEKLLYAFLYRIPTEGKYSVFPIKVKKFSFPCQGQGVILPKEVNIVSNIDFDGDKLYAYYYNFSIKNKSERDEYIVNDLVSTFSISSDKAKCYFEIVKNENNNLQYLGQIFCKYEMERIQKIQALYHSYYKVKDQKLFRITRNDINIYPSELDSYEGTQNLTLDIYFSLAKTSNFYQDILSGFKLNQIKSYLDDRNINFYSILSKYSFADPVFQFKYLDWVTNNYLFIKIFGSLHSFANAIHPVTYLRLKKPIEIRTIEKTYYLDSMGYVCENRLLLISELYHLSINRDKFDQLAHLGLNRKNVYIFATLISLFNDSKIDNKIIEFADIMRVINDKDNAANLNEIRDISSKYFSVIKYFKYFSSLGTIETTHWHAHDLAQKLTQTLGDTFSNISEFFSFDDKGFRFSELKFSFKLLKIKDSILMKDLAVYHPIVKNIHHRILKNTPMKSTISLDEVYFKIIDIAIRNYLDELNVIEYLQIEFPSKIQTYKFPGSTGVLRQAFEFDKQGTLKMRWVNIHATNILDQYTEAFSDLFDFDFEMAKELSIYAFLTGTKFTMAGLVKIVPSKFYVTDVGANIRDIINGKQLEKYIHDIEAVSNKIMF